MTGTGGLAIPFVESINSPTMAANVINIHDPSLKSPSDNVANDDMNSEMVVVIGT